MGNVLSNQVEVLLTYAPEYPYVAFILKENAEVISQMLNDALIKNDSQDGMVLYDFAKVENAATAWKSANPQLSFE